jgi:hypothetical protein
MTLIEQIKADREAGTAGPWAKMHDHPDPAVAASLARIRSKDDRVWSGNEIALVFCCDYINDGRQEQEYNARRIARVPDMEEALLAADELADAIKAVIDLENNTSPSGGEVQADRIVRTQNECIAALAAYRKATGS